MVALGAGAHVFVGDAELRLAGESGEIGRKTVGEIDDFGKGDGFGFICPNWGRQAGPGGNCSGGGKEGAPAEGAGDGFLAERGAHDG